MNELVELWNKCLEIIGDNVSEEVFSTWFRPIVPLSIARTAERATVMLSLPSMFYYEYIEEKYGTLLNESLRKVIGLDVDLNYKVMTDLEGNITTDLPTTQPIAKTMQVFSPFQRTVQPDIDTQLAPRLRFDNFIEGSCNRLARSAGLAVAENPGNTPFNPLFIYGASGVGKTHLVNAIGLEAKRLNPQKRVLYVSASTFQIQYTDSVGQNKINDFLNFYQSLDVLILDDIHDFMGKAGTQGNFFKIFNHLQHLGKQIIMTCDRQPSELNGMEERLLTRFRWGLTVEMTRPDFKLRRDILLYRIKQDGLEIADDVVDYIAENVTENVRGLEGILISLMAKSVLNQQTIDIDLVKSVIKRTPAPQKQLKVEDICSIVCQYFSVSPEDLGSRSRKATITQPRQIAMYLARKHTTSSLDAIAASVNRTHATVIHSCNLIEDLLSTDKNLQRDIKALESKLR